MLLPSILLWSFYFLYFFEFSAGYCEEGYVFTANNIGNFSEIPALPWDECWLPCMKLSLHHEKNC